MFEPAWYLWVMVGAAVLGFALSVGFLLRNGLVARSDRPGAMAVGVMGSGAMLGLVGINATLAALGLYRRSPESPVPWIALVLIATIIGMLALARTSRVAPALDAPGALVRLTLPHTFRIFGVVFLIAMADGGLPAVFAVPAGVGDIAIGLAAPFVAWRLGRGGGTGVAISFNLLGALDLVMALTLGFMTAPGLFQVIEASPTTEAVSVLPLALIPSFAVPTAITLHVLSLRRLLAVHRVRQEVAHA